MNTILKEICIVIMVTLTLFGCSCSSDAVVKDETTTTQETTEISHKKRWDGQEREGALSDECTEEYIASLKEGKNEYIVKAAEYDFNVFTSADPYEYFRETDDGEEFFDLKKLLDDYGWKEIDNPYDDYSLGYDQTIKEGRTYSYESGDMTILLQSDS